MTGPEEKVTEADIVPPRPLQQWQVARARTGEIRLTVSDEFDTVVLFMRPDDACRLAQVLNGAAFDQGEPCP